MKLDPKALARESFSDARALVVPKARELGQRGEVIYARFRQLEQDTEDTLTALAVVQRPEAAKSLREDLEIILPARKAALLAAVEAELGSAGKALLEAALEIGIKIAITVARAFIPVL